MLMTQPSAGRPLLDVTPSGRAVSERSMSGRLIQAPPLAAPCLIFLIIHSKYVSDSDGSNTTDT